ncbi:unnamed protein product [Notodromas monacha]|uniref:Protein quiver n=1 Tax=Notodromas monacha TaxID=399045 RepID=A0A7R9BRZ6_9CRUS|nr:unnamed protein product [Notodromas monacha]CAG0919093.1 unnamed protein product [Notodromas monacha]
MSCSSIHGVEAIRCHVCKFSGPPDDWGINCNDPFNINGTLRECSLEMFYDSSGSIPPPNMTAFFCRKTVQRDGVEAIRCHVCKFSGPPDDWGINCNDPFNINGTLRECSLEMFYDSSGSIPPPNMTAFFCRKTVQRDHYYYYNYNYYYYCISVHCYTYVLRHFLLLLVKRSCAWEEYDVKGKECYMTGDLNFSTLSCVCYTDGCNTAAPALMLASVATYLLISAATALITTTTTMHLSSA